MDAGAARCLTPKVVVLAMTGLGLVGCQSLPRAVDAVDDGTPAAQAYQARRAQFASLDHWSLRGRSALHAHGRGWSGSLHWTQAGERLDLRLIAPLGAGTVRISGDPALTRIQASDGTDFVTAAPAADLGHWLGAPLPVHALRWWIVGLPPPGAEVSALAIDTGGRVTGFDQGGWRVRFPRYTEHDGTVVPGVIEARSGDARVRVIVDRWQAGP